MRGLLGRESQHMAISNPWTDKLLFSQLVMGPCLYVCVFYIAIYILRRAEHSVAHQLC